jgi:hypothetical protein
MVLLEAIVALWTIGLVIVTVILMVLGCLGALGLVTLVRCERCRRLHLVVGPPSQTSASCHHHSLFSRDRAVQRLHAAHHLTPFHHHHHS